MIYTIRLELAGLAARAAWALAPRTGINTRYEVPGFILTRRLRSYRVWPTALRTTIRSFLSHNWIADGIVSADTAWCKFVAWCRAIATRKPLRAPSLSQLIRTLNFHKPSPPTR